MTVESPNMIPPEALELSAENIGRMSPEMARDTLAAMQARHAAANPVDRTTHDGRLTMTPAEATAALDEMELARRPLGADGKPVPEVPYSGITSSVEMNARRIEDAINHLETNGFPARGTPVGDELHGMLDGTFAVTPEVEKAVRAKHAQCIADRGWCKLLLDGDQKTTRDFHTMNAILAAVEVQRPSRFGHF